MSIKVVLRQLFEAYPNNKATEGTVAIYHRMLRDTPIDELQTVIYQCIVECTFLPTVAEILERHRLLTADVNAPTAEQGWQDVMYEMRRVGTWDKPQFDDPVVASVVKSLGGWVALCSSPEKDLPHWRRAFLEQYAGMTKRRNQLAKMTPESLQFIADRHGGTSAGDAARNLLEKLNGHAPKEIAQDDN